MNLGISGNFKMVLTKGDIILFLKECKEYFPFYITHILTDNGGEFTDRFVSKNKQASNILCPPLSRPF